MQQFSIIDYVCTTTIKSTYETHYHENVYTYPSFNEPSTSLTLSATENYHQPWKNKSLHQDESVSLRLFTTLNNMSMSLVGPLNRSFGTDQLTLDLLYFSLTNAQPNPYDNFQPSNLLGEVRANQERLHLPVLCILKLMPKDIDHLRERILKTIYLDQGKHNSKIN